MFPPKAEEFNIATPVVSELSKERIAQQEFLQAGADAERIRLANQELRLKTIAKGVQKKSEIDAINIAMAEHRLQEGELWVDAEFRAAENRIQSTEANLRNEADQALETLRAEETTQRLRAMEIEQQLKTYYYNEQGIRDKSVARSMQQRLIELEHQSRMTTEDLVGLSELKLREKALKEESAYKARKALDKASRPGSSRDVPAEPTVVSATATNTKVITETIKE